MSSASFSNADNLTLTVAVVEFAAGLTAHNPAAKRSAKALLKTHDVMPYATSFSQYFSKCQNQITRSPLPLTIPFDQKQTNAWSCQECLRFQPQYKTNIYIWQC